MKVSTTYGLVVVVIVLSLFNFINAKTYLNFIPYPDKECSSTPSGTGFSSLIDTCFTFDQTNNWLFTRISENEVSWTQFKSVNHAKECNEPTSNPIVVMNNTCINGLDISFDISNVNMNSNLYYRIVLEEDYPTIPSRSFVVAYTHEVCDRVNNLVLLEYYTNGTTYGYYSSANSFMQYCDHHNHACSINCINGFCSRPVIDNINCEPRPSFFNSSSSESNSNQNYGGGNDSTSTSNSNSGSGSASASSGSGTSISNQSGSNDSNNTSGSNSKLTTGSNSNISGPGTGSMSGYSGTRTGSGNQPVNTDSGTASSGSFSGTGSYVPPWASSEETGYFLSIYCSM